MTQPSPTIAEIEDVSPVEETQTKEIATAPQPETDEEFVARIGALVVEDFIATALLRHGRALPSTDFNNAPELPISRAKLREAGEHLSRVLARSGNLDLKLRAEFADKPRDERARKPLERTVEELTQNVGKPLPLPVSVREVSQMRGVVPAAINDSLAQVLKTSHRFVEGAPNAWMHVSFFLDSAAPRDDLVRRLNNLESERDWSSVENLEAPSEGALASRAVSVLGRANRPLPLRVLGYLLWRADNSVTTQQLARALSDRAVFHFYVGGIVTTQAQKPAWNALAARWMDTFESAQNNIDVTALLRVKLSGAAKPPSEADLQKIIEVARLGNGKPISLDEVLTEILEREADAETLAPELQGLNEALRRDNAWLPVGLGKFLLRESVPNYVGSVPEILRPVHLAVRAGGEEVDVEMSDDGLEGDCATFIHDPQWEDVGEEVEVKMTRRAGSEVPASTRYVMTYPHHVAGTLKLRRIDEEFFDVSGPLSRLPVRAIDEEGSVETALWSSRESGLLYGLADWYSPRTPSSGGVLEFSREAGGVLTVRIGADDKATFLDGNRVEELESLQERAAYSSLFDLLQTVFESHGGGAELPTLWAEINVIRRTSKRQMCSILSAYHSFYFKQRGQNQILWRFDAERLDQGFKKNKRKFVRK